MSNEDQIQPLDYDVKLKIAEQEMKLEQAVAGREIFEKWHKENGYTFISADEDPEPVDWMIENYITYNGITLFDAKSKLGKSSIVQELALGAASGTGAIKSLEGGWLFEFQGKPVKTYYLDTENSRSLIIRRMDSLAQEKGLNRKELLASGQLRINCLEVALIPPFLKPDRENIEDDIDRAKEWAAVLKSEGVKFIILDVLSHCYQNEKQGRDEIDRGFIADFFKIINAIKSVTEAAILLVHHHRKGDRAGNESSSGSSQLLRTPTALISLFQEPEKDNPEGNLYTLEINGREIKSRKKWLKSRSSNDDTMKVFDHVPEPVREKKSPGRPGGDRKKVALDILDAVLLDQPAIIDKQITPKEWADAVYKVSLMVPEWQRAPDTVKDYLKKDLLIAGRAKMIQSGIYQIVG